MQMFGNKDMTFQVIWQHPVLYVSKHMYEHNHFDYEHALSEGSVKGTTG